MCGKNRQLTLQGVLLLKVQAWIHTYPQSISNGLETLATVVKVGVPNWACHSKC